MPLQFFKLQVFEGNIAWWDLLVVLNLPERSATVFSPEEKAKDDERRNKKTASQGPAPPVASVQTVSEETEEQKRADALFISKVLSGIRVYLGEEWVQSMFRDLTHTIMDLCLDESDPLLTVARSSDSGWKKAITMNSIRIAAFRSSCNATSLNPDPWVGSDGKSSLEGPEKGASLRRDLRLLVQGTNIGAEELERIFSDLTRALQSEDAVQVLLCILPESLGGLHSIAAALLHKSTAVRGHAAALLRKIEGYETTAPAFNALNPFFLIAYQRAPRN